MKLGDYRLAISDIFGGNAFLPVIFLVATLVSGKAVLPHATVLIYLPIAELSVNMFIIFGMGGAVGFLSGLFGVGGGFLLTPLRSTRLTPTLRPRAVSTTRETTILSRPTNAPDTSIAVRGFVFISPPSSFPMTMWLPSTGRC